MCLHEVTVTLFLCTHDSNEDRSVLERAQAHTYIHISIQFNGLDREAAALKLKICVQTCA